MDCYFHHAVPSVARCTGCGKTICATCRAETGDCPACRLAARVDAAAGEHRLHGAVGPASPPPPPPRVNAAAVAVRPESRALAALGYPFWPLALLALLDPAKSPYVRRNAWQALGFNGAMYGLAWLISSIAAIPFIGISAWPLLPFVAPVAVVASIVYAYKAWRGDEVRIPFVSDAVDARLADTASTR